MTRLPVTPLRVRQAHVEWVQDRLSGRDWQIIESVGRLRLLTGEQLERLHFFALADSSRARTRRRVLARLVAWRVLLTLERRIGGVRAGSSGLVFALDSAGFRLRTLATQAAGEPVHRPRREEPSAALLGHTLGVAEVATQLTELSRTDGFTLRTFDAEPACWWPNGLGGFLKPDAYLVLALPALADAWWLEHDTGTESLPVLDRKLHTYLDFVTRGGVGPNSVTPRVLVSVPTERRAAAVRALMRALPEPAGKLFYVATHAHAVRVIVRVLRE